MPVNCRCLGSVRPQSLAAHQLSVLWQPFLWHLIVPSSVVFGHCQWHLKVSSRFATRAGGVKLDPPGQAGNEHTAGDVNVLAQVRGHGTLCKGW